MPFRINNEFQEMSTQLIIKSYSWNHKLYTHAQILRWLLLLIKMVLLRIFCVNCVFMLEILFVTKILWFFYSTPHWRQKVVEKRTSLMLYNNELNYFLERCWQLDELFWNVCSNGHTIPYHVASAENR